MAQTLRTEHLAPTEDEWLANEVLQVDACLRAAMIVDDQGNTISYKHSDGSPDSVFDINSESLVVPISNLGLVAYLRLEPGAPKQTIFDKVTDALRVPVSIVTR